MDIGDSMGLRYIARLEYGKNPETNIDLSTLRLLDGGDIPRTLDLEEAHNQLRERIEEVLRSRAIGFVVGGGNDQSYPNAKALMNWCCK
jgi:formiminoglutamase